MILQEAKVCVKASCRAYKKNNFEARLLSIFHSIAFKHTFSIHLKNNLELSTRASIHNQNLNQCIQKTHFYRCKNKYFEIKHCFSSFTRLKLHCPQWLRFDIPKCFSTSKVPNEITLEQNNCNSILERTENGFLDSIDNARKPEEILALTKSFLNAGKLRSHHLVPILVKYRTLVYCGMVPNFTVKDEGIQKKQIRLNLLSQKMVEEFVFHPDFQELLQFSESQIHLLTLQESVLILNALQWFELTTKDSIFQELKLKCIDNIHEMSLPQLAFFSSSLTDSFDYSAMSKVVEKAKQIIFEDDRHVDLNDICVIFSNVRKVVSSELYIACAKKMVSILKQNPSQMSLENLIKLIYFAHISENECLEIIINALLSFPPESFKKIDIGTSGLTLDVALFLNGAPWQCQQLKKMSASCANELCTENSLPVQDVVKLSLACNKYIINNNKQAAEKLAICVQNLDNFLFTEYLQHFKNMWPLKLNLAQAFQDRLVKFLQELEEHDFNHFILQDETELALLILRYYQKLQQIGLPVDKTIENVVKRLTKFHVYTWCWPKHLALHVVTDAVEKLSLNSALFSGYLTTVLKVLRCLDLDELIMFNRDVESILMSRDNSKTVKFQSFQIRKTISEIFHSHLNQANRLSPALITHKAIPPSLLYETKPGLLEPLLCSLPRFTCDREEINCMRALRILELTAEKFQVYQEDTFENLLAYVITNPNEGIYSKFQYVKAASYAAYMPMNSNCFISMCQQLCQDIIQADLLEKRLQVELAYSLSLFGIYFDMFLNRIFTVDFLSKLDEELADLSLKGALRIRNIMITLSQSVALECPHLSIYRINNNTKLPKLASDATSVIEKMYHSLARLCGSTCWVQMFGESSYGHKIDAVLYVQDKLMLVTPEEGEQKFKAGENIDRIAVLYLGKGRYCMNSDHLNGQITAKIRHLEMLGYIIVQVPYSDLSSMVHQTDNGLDRYLQNKINAAVGCDLLNKQLDEFS
ncbi:FAST kinase domain-containing protein 1 [Biomphalaria glabrata]|nr:FAST kinase domain-containing protein 1-like [Biomphalaria glabrata]